MILTPAELKFLLSLMKQDSFSSIRPDPSFTGQDAIKLADRLKAELEKAG